MGRQIWPQELGFRHGSHRETGSLTPHTVKLTEVLFTEQKISSCAQILVKKAKPYGQLNVSNILYTPGFLPKQLNVLSFNAQKENVCNLSITEEGQIKREQDEEREIHALEYFRYFHFQNEASAAAVSPPGVWTVQPDLEMRQPGQESHPTPAPTHSAQPGFNATAQSNNQSVPSNNQPQPQQPEEIFINGERFVRESNCDV